MSDRRYLTVKEFADKAGISKQSVYKQLNKVDSKLNNYSTKIDNQRMIDISALKEVYGIEELKGKSKHNQSKSQPIQPESQPNQPTVESIQARYIDTLEKQLEDKSRELKEALKLLDQQQQLSLNLQNKLDKLEFNLPDPNEQIEQEPEEVKEEIESETLQVEPKEPEEKNSGFLSRLFKRN